MLNDLMLAQLTRGITGSAGAQTGPGKGGGYKTKGGGATGGAGASNNPALGYSLDSAAGYAGQTAWSTMYNDDLWRLLAPEEFAKGASATKVLKGFGAAGIALAPVPDIVENVEKGASAAEFAADITVDVGIAAGAIGLTVAAFAIFTPAGWAAVAVGVGIAAGVWLATDVFTVNGETPAQHAKNGLTDLFGG
jgi:hypothetical protein